MIRKLLACAIVVLCVGVIASSASAVTRWSYNPSTFNPIRIIGQWSIGNQRIALATHDFCQDGQKIFALTEVWLNHFTGEITVNVTTAPTGQPCP